MATLKAIRKRISSIRNTQQITKAMKMVSAAKLRRAQEAAVQARPYADKMAELLRNVAQQLGHLVRVRTSLHRGFLRAAQLRRRDHLHGLGDLLRVADRADPLPDRFEGRHYFSEISVASVPLARETLSTYA